MLYWSTKSHIYDWSETTKRWSGKKHIDNTSKCWLGCIVTWQMTRTRWKTNKPNPVVCGVVRRCFFRLNSNFLHSKLSSLHAWIGKLGCRQMTPFEFLSRDADDGILIITPDLSQHNVIDSDKVSHCASVKAKRLTAIWTEDVDRMIKSKDMDT